MPLRLFNSLTGGLEDFAPARPPIVDFLWGSPVAPGGTREEVFVAALLDSLAYLGLTVNQAVEGSERSVDLYCGARPPSGARLWLKPEGGVRPLGLQAPLWRFICLRTHYRRPLDTSAGALRAAEEEWRFLHHTRAQGAGRAGAANATALAGYRKRLRDALSRDLDFPGVVAVLLDSLRPGALSPGSRLAALSEAEAVLGQILSL